MNTSSTCQVSPSGLHAGIAARADQRTKVERLCRYIARPAVAEPRLSLTERGEVRYTLKTPYRDGTTHVVFQPLDFLAAAGGAGTAIPRVNLTRRRRASGEQAWVPPRGVLVCRRQRAQHERPLPALRTHRDPVGNRRAQQPIQRGGLLAGSCPRRPRGAHQGDP
jgi:hypothetical protein